MAAKYKQVIFYGKTISRQRTRCFLQDDATASAGIQSLQISIEIKLCQNPSNGPIGLLEFSA